MGDLVKGMVVSMALFVVLGWIPKIGPLIAGLAGGYVAAGGLLRGFLAGFMGALAPAAILGALIAVAGTALLGPLGALLGAGVAGFAALVLLGKAVIAGVGGAIGGLIASLLEQKKQ